MFGSNPRTKVYKTPGDVLDVVEASPFYTIQGEGPHTGLPAIFVRLAHCNMQCNFCDTDFTDDVEQITPKEIVAEAHAQQMHTDLWIITGGEPCLQDLGPLLREIYGDNPQAVIQIETNGLFWQKCFDKYVALQRLEFVVSPKTPKVHDFIAAHAIAWKYIVGLDSQFDGEGRCHTVIEGELETCLAPPPDHLCRKRVYLQPCDMHQEEANRVVNRKVVKYAQQFGFRVGLQTHKFLGVL